MLKIVIGGIRNGFGITFCEPPRVSTSLTRSCRGRFFPSGGLCRSGGLSRSLTGGRTSIAGSSSHEPWPESRPSFGKARTYVLGALLLISVPTIGIIYFSTPSPDESLLDQRRFKPFTITSKKPISPNSFILTLRPHRGGVFDGTESLPGGDEKDPFQIYWEGGIWSVEFKQPQLQISRRYTPLPPLDGSVPGELRFLIRKYEGGEVSNYLDRLRVGAIVELRAPKVEYEIPRRENEGLKEVLFLAGGTGIAPAIQIVYSLLQAWENNEGKVTKPRITVLWSSRRREDCVGGVNPATEGWGRSLSWLWPSKSTVTFTERNSQNLIVQQLEDLKRESEGRLRVEYLVDEEGTFITDRKIRRVIERSMEFDISGHHKKVEDEKSHEGGKVVLVSGPDGFVDFLAGRKELEGEKRGRSDGGKGAGGAGGVGGVLEGLKGGLDKGGWVVVRL